MTEPIRVEVNMKEFFNNLEGDVHVDSMRQIEIQGLEYTVVDWMHDGIACYDVWETFEGGMKLYVRDGDEDALFEAVYTNTVASVRLPVEEIDAVVKGYVLNSIY